MSETAMQLTLREMRSIFVNPKVLVVMAVVSVGMGLAGPFGTYDVLSLGARLAYWMVTVFATFAAGNFTATWISALVWTRLNRWLRIPLVGICAAMPITLVVLLLNLLAFGSAIAPIDALTLFIYCVLIAIGMVLVFDIVQPRRGDGSFASESAAQTPPPLLQRLPLHKRGALVRLSVQDHYVEIETTKGIELVLMRLADAIKETAGISGLQVHRSHWVALDAIANVKRTGGKVAIETASGGAVPVSRTYLPALKQAGLIV